MLRLSKEDEERQITTLLDCFGKYANDVLTSTNISKECRKKYTAVLPNLIHTLKYAGIYLNVCDLIKIQEKKESIKQFITSLYSLSEIC